MALEASPPPAEETTDVEQSRLDELDDEITKAQAQVDALMKKNAIFAASLLASDNIRDRFQQDESVAGNTDISGLLENRQQSGQANIHRLAYGVTTFPFVDPSPDASGRALLGIRFDIHRRGGVYGPAYYIFCERSGETSQELVLSQHTVPAFIPVDQYRSTFLPLSDEGYDSDEPAGGVAPTVQNLEAFVNHIRTDLINWHTRQDAISDLQGKLHLENTSDPESITSQHGVASLQATSMDANYINIEWLDGRIARLKLGSDLRLEKAVVFKQGPGGEQRDDLSEAIILAQDADLATLPDRLRLLHKEQKQRAK